MSITKRFEGVDWFKKYKNFISIIGVGGIGSWTSLLLSRAGYNLILMDYDKIEEHNIGGGFYTTNDIGKYKVRALGEHLEIFSPISNIIINTEKFISNSSLGAIVISAVDSIPVRKLIFQQWKRHCAEIRDHDSEKPCLFVDGRLLAEMYQIYAIRYDKPEELKFYEESLFDDSNRNEEGSCSLQQTSHAAAKLASEIVESVTNHISNFQNKEKMRTEILFKHYEIKFGKYIKNEISQNK